MRSSFGFTNKVNLRDDNAGLFPNAKGVLRSDQLSSAENAAVVTNANSESQPLIYKKARA